MQCYGISRFYGFSATKGQGLYLIIFTHHQIILALKVGVICLQLKANSNILKKTEPVIKDNWNVYLKKKCRHGLFRLLITTINLMFLSLSLEKYNEYISKTFSGFTCYKSGLKFKILSCLWIVSSKWYIR